MSHHRAIFQTFVCQTASQLKLKHVFGKRFLGGGKKSVTCWKHSNGLRAVMQKKKKMCIGSGCGCSLWQRNRECGCKLFVCPSPTVAHQGQFIKVTCVCMLNCFSCVLLCASLWTVACQAPLSMGSSRQEYWHGLPCPSPGDLPDPPIEPKIDSLVSPALARAFVTTSTT